MGNRRVIAQKKIKEIACLQLHKMQPKLIMDVTNPTQYHSFHGEQNTCSNVNFSRFIHCHTYTKRRYCRFPSRWRMYHCSRVRRSMNYVSISQTSWYWNNQSIRISTSHTQNCAQINRTTFVRYFSMHSGMLLYCLLSFVLPLCVLMGPINIV